MALSKFPKFLSGSGDYINSNNVNWRTVLKVGTPIALVVGGIAYWRYGKSFRKSDSKQTTGDNDGEGDISKFREVSANGGLHELPESSRLKEAGNELFKQGRFSEALEYYTKAIELLETKRNETDDILLFNEREQLEKLYQNRAAVHEKKGAFDMVIHETTLALELNPRYIKALTRRAAAYKTLGFCDEALEDYTAVCLIQKFSSPSSNKAADDLISALGIRDGKRIMMSEKKPPIVPSSHYVKKYMKTFLNCPLSKLFINGDAENLRNTCCPSPYIQALICLLDGKYDSIIALCSEELLINNSRYWIESHYLRGTFYLLYGYYDETLGDLNEVIESKNATTAFKATSLIKRAMCYGMVHKDSLALQSFEESEQIWSDNVDLWHQQGQLLLRQGNLAGCIQLLARALTIDPECAYAAATKGYAEYRLAGLMRNLDKQSKCIREFKLLLRKFLHVSEVYSVYGQIMMENQLFEEAEMYFTTALKLDPENANIMVHKAMNRFQMSGNLQQAINTVNDALKIDNRCDFIFITLGTLYLQSGDMTKSIENLNKAIELSQFPDEVIELCGLKKAAEVQKTVLGKLGITHTLPFGYTYTKH